MGDAIRKPNGRIIKNSQLGRTLKEAVSSYFKALLQHSHSGSDENCKYLKPR